MKLKVRKSNGCHNCKYDLLDLFGDSKAIKKCSSCVEGSNWKEIEVEK